MTPSISRVTHEARYDCVVGHGPRLSSAGWVSSPRFEPKNGQEMIGPRWYSFGMACSAEGTTNEGFGVRIAEIPLTSSVGEKGNAEYRSESALGVGEPDPTETEGSGPK